jgi:hypothetical protein
MKAQGKAILGTTRRNVAQALRLAQNWLTGGQIKKAQKETAPGPHPSLEAEEAAWLAQHKQTPTCRGQQARSAEVEDVLRSDIPVSLQNSDNFLERLLSHKYTPVGAAAVGVLVTDGLTLAFPQFYPAWYSVGRIAMVASLASTGYQAWKGLHGTTKLDFYLSLGMSVIGLIPFGPDIAMAHAQFFYGVYTTWLRK